MTVDLDTETVAFTRVCRRCSAQSTTGGDSCPACGTAFVRASRKPSKRLIVVIGILVLALAAVGAGLLIKQNRDAAEADRVAAAAAERVAERESAAAEAEEAANEVEREWRADTVEQLEENITKDAKENVADGFLDGPIKYSSCTAVGGSTDDLTALTATFDCIAVNKEHKDGTASGYQYAGTADWTSGEMTWQLGG